MRLSPNSFYSKRPIAVFNIRGSKYRLLCAIHFNRKIIFVRDFLPHAEYSKDHMKTTSWKAEMETRTHAVWESSSQHILCGIAQPSYLWLQPLSTRFGPCCPSSRMPRRAWAGGSSQAIVCNARQTPEFRASLAPVRRIVWATP